MENTSCFHQKCSVKHILFVGIFAQYLDLHGIAQKLVPSFSTSARKQIWVKVFAKVFFCFSFLLPYIRFSKFASLKEHGNQYLPKFPIFAQKKCTETSPPKNFYEQGTLVLFNVAQLIFLLRDVDSYSGFPKSPFLPWSCHLPLLNEEQKTYPIYA